MPRDAPAPLRKSKRRAWDELAADLKALADPTRLEIVAMVAAAREPLCACEIEARFDLAQSTISHHLALLRNAGVLVSERRGTWAFYSVAPGAAAALDAVGKLLER